jgi:2-C-methyl-D-erythritol 4-phosphate cytidylyltransferase
MHLKEYAVIVAGGKGTRMQSKIPKQFVELCGLPVLLHTLNAFYRYSEAITIILVLPADDVAYWQTITAKFSFRKPVIIVAGGESRFQSVKNGLQQINGDGLVAIHDGVRPLVSSGIIEASFRLAALNGSAIASVPLKESLRVEDDLNTKAVDRSRYRLIQTPQTFDVSLIKKAYMMTEDSTLTDDASVAEKAGNTVQLFDGSYENLKITTPEDLIVAEALLRNKQQL